MPKEIVTKDQINLDPALALVKTFRLTNKRAGEHRRMGENIEYLMRCDQLKALSNQAEQEYGFSIWVNPNGRTGHTYTKDYKETQESDNDYASHLLRINRLEGMDAPVGPETDDAADEPSE